MIRALAFDIQGTAVDFHEPMMRACAELAVRSGLDVDWGALVADWRGLYREAMDAINAGTHGFETVDAIYRRTLDTLLEARGLDTAVPAMERDTLNAVWRRLDPWPDSIAGLDRLRRRFVLTTLSNASMAALVALVKHAALPFDAILGAELARAYKPSPSVYRLAVDYLGLPTEEIMMVACHAYDLRAAQAFGMKTAFVARPLEFGPGGAPGRAPEAAFDIVARDFCDLADQLGA